VREGLLGLVLIEQDDKTVVHVISPFGSTLGLPCSVKLSDGARALTFPFDSGS
jgi:hypothetical protein